MREERVTDYGEELDVALCVLFARLNRYSSTW